MNYLLLYDYLLSVCFLFRFGHINADAITTDEVSREIMIPSAASQRLNSAINKVNQEIEWIGQHVINERLNPLLDKLRQKIQEIAQNYKWKILFANVLIGNETILPDGNTFLTLALLNYLISIELEEREGRSPKEGSDIILETIEYLVEKGVDVNKPNEAGLAPIHFATTDAKLMNAFLKSPKVDCGARDPFGDTALDVAYKRGNEALIRDNKALIRDNKALIRKLLKYMDLFDQEKYTGVAELFKEPDVRTSMQEVNASCSAKSSIEL